MGSGASGSAAGTRIRNKAPWYRVPLRAAHSQIHVEEVIPKAPRSSKKKNPLSTSKSRPRIIWAFPGEREPPSLGLGRQRHGGEAAPGRPPGWFLPPPGGAPGPTQARAIICPVGELMNKRHTSGEMTGSPGCSRRSRIPGHHGTPIRVREDTCSFATAAVTNRHELGGLKQHTFILLESRRSESVSTR